MPAENCEHHEEADDIGDHDVPAVAERSPVLPDIPPVADTLPGYAIPFWTAIFAPANTPKEIVERIAAENRKAMQHPDVLRRYGELGVVGVGSSPQELDRFWRQQLDYLGKIVKDANVKPVVE